MASQPIYQFHSKLKEYKPTIWRQFQVAGNITMARLGYIVMTMYEMQASHMFSIDYSLFENHSSAEKIHPHLKSEHLVHHYELISDESLPDADTEKTHDATKRTLRQLTDRPGLRLSMMYDYGNGWEIELTLEKIILDETLDGKQLPRVLAGKGFGIIEDCGGPDGLTQLAKAFRDRIGPEYCAFSTRLGRKNIDLDSFDIDDMNFRLKKVPRIYRDIYERNRLPSNRSLDLLNREYLK